MPEPMPEVTNELLNFMGRRNYSLRDGKFIHRLEWTTLTIQQALEWLHGVTNH